MKILLVEDHPIFRLGTRHLVAARWPDAEIRETGSLAEAMDLVRGEDWTVALLDLNLPDANGVEVISRLLRVAPNLRVLVLSLNAEAAYAARALQIGASGYLAKDRASEELTTAVERLLAGKRYISATLAEALADRVISPRPEYPHETLSTQEFRVMAQLADGRRISDIAVAMCLSPKTISTYRARILEKLGVEGNIEIARYCAEHGLIDSIPLKREAE